MCELGRAMLPVEPMPGACLILAFPGLVAGPVASAAAEVCFQRVPSAKHGPYGCASPYLEVGGCSR